MKIWLYNHIIWYLKQLLPFEWHTEYRLSDGELHVTTWNMWFGQCFNIDDWAVKE